MKVVVAMILIFTLYEACADQIQVSYMSRSPDFYKRYDLKTSLNQKVVLDCQSFIQGLLCGELGEGVIMLQEWECEELIIDMKKSHSRRKKHCLEVDFDRSVLDSQATCL